MVESFPTRNVPGQPLGKVKPRSDKVAFYWKGSALTQDNIISDAKALGGLAVLNAHVFSGGPSIVTPSVEFSGLDPFGQDDPVAHFNKGSFNLAEHIIPPWGQLKGTLQLYVRPKSVFINQRFIEAFPLQFGAVLGATTTGLIIGKRFSGTPFIAVFVGGIAGTSISANVWTNLAVNWDKAANQYSVYQDGSRIEGPTALGDTAANAPITSILQASTAFAPDAYMREIYCINDGDPSSATINVPSAPLIA